MESTSLPTLDQPHPNPIGLRVGAPAPFYCTGEESLRVTSFGSLAGVVLAVRNRFLRVDGVPVPSGDRHVPNSDRSIATTEHPLAEGWLLGCELHASTGSPRRGQVFVVVDVIRGGGTAATVLQTLVQGYVTDTSRLTWPGSPIQSSIDGPGVLRSITGTDPAAGAEISETVPTNARWQIHAIRFSLVASAAVANREVALVYDDGANVFARIPSRVTQTAAQTIAYSSFRDAALEAVAQDTERWIRLPWLSLQGGHRFRTITTALDVGDNYGAPQYLVEEWIED